MVTRVIDKRPMKKQHFYIFYSENEKSAETEDVQFKLVKSYMNYFCINEDDQAEVIEVHQLKEIRKYFQNCATIYQII